MIKLNIYGIDGNARGEIQVDSIPEDFKPDRMLIARSLRRQLSNARIPCAHTKTRGEVRGGGRKPWREKGTGRARQGSIRANQWRGGGIAFGPRPNRNWNIDMNKKERKAAIRHIVWSKIQNGDWILFEDFEMEKPSTKRGKAFLDSIGRSGKILLLVPNDDVYENIWKSLRNLPNVSILAPERLNTFDLLNNQTVIVHKKAFEKVRETWQV